MMQVETDGRTYECEFVEVHLEGDEPMLLLRNRQLPDGGVEEERKLWPSKATIRDNQFDATPIIRDMSATSSEWAPQHGTPVIEQDGDPEWLEPGTESLVERP